MSKKPIPELLGDDEYLRQHHVIEISVGALQVFRVAKLDDDNSRDEPITAGELFSGGFFYGADELMADVRKAGFPKYPVRAAMAELEKIAEQYVGAAPNIKDPKNLPASYAWVLANFADVKYYHQKFMSENNFVKVWGMGVLMGRLAEWWNWRKEGHDLDAVQQASFSLGRDKKEGAKAVRQSKDRRRREIADIVGKLGDAPRFKVGKKAGEVNFSAWAREVLKEARIDSALAHKDGDHVKAGILNEIAGQTEKTVISAIKFAIQCGEIGKTK